jgi:hypothetical protein
MRKSGALWVARGRSLIGSGLARLDDGHFRKLEAMPSYNIDLRHRSQAAGPHWLDMDLDYVAPQAM